MLNPKGSIFSIIEKETAGGLNFSYKLSTFIALSMIAVVVRVKYELKPPPNSSKLQTSAKTKKLIELI